MIIDGQNTAQQNATQGDIIFDATMKDFEDRVIKKSMDIPVVVDLWAPWCGPCKQLGPVLENAVQGAGGQVLMAKVNIDENPELAQALRVQSVPTVYAFYQGQPVDAFTGAKPESEIKAFVEKLMGLSGNDNQMPGLDEALAQARELAEQENPAAAQQIYGSILQHDPENAEAYAGMARIFLDNGQADGAKQMLEQVPDSIKDDDRIVAVAKALALSEEAAEHVAAMDDLHKKLAKNTDDHQARYDLAQALYATGQEEQAVEALIEIIQRKRDWNEDAARLKLLEYFEAMGPTHSVTVQGRRQLSSILFS